MKNFLNADMFLKPCEPFKQNVGLDLRSGTFLLQQDGSRFEMNLRDIFRSFPQSG